MKSRISTSVKLRHWRKGTKVRCFLSVTFVLTSVLWVKTCFCLPLCLPPNNNHSSNYLHRIFISSLSPFLCPDSQWTWLPPGSSTSLWACWCSRPPPWCSPCDTPAPCRPRARGTWPPQLWCWPRSWRSSPVCCSSSRSTVSAPGTHCKSY